MLNNTMLSVMLFIVHSSFLIFLVAVPYLSSALGIFDIIFIIFIIFIVYSSLLEKMNDLQK